MIYTLDVTTPPNTVKNAPLKVFMPLTRGLVHRVELDFPSGALGLHHVVIIDGDHRLWPSTEHETFHPDGVVIAFDDIYLKLSPPYEFLIQTYNLDDTYEHLVQVRIGLIANEMVWSRFIPEFVSREKLRDELRSEDEKAQTIEEIMTDPFSIAAALRESGE